MVPVRHRAIKLRGATVETVMAQLYKLPDPTLGRTLPAGISEEGLGMVYVVVAVYRCVSYRCRYGWSWLGFELLSQVWLGS